MMPHRVYTCMECGRTREAYEVIKTHGQRCQCGAPMHITAESDTKPEPPEDPQAGMYSWERTAGL